jgi:hypothetical protein
MKHFAAHALAFGLTLAASISLAFAQTFPDHPRSSYRPRIGFFSAQLIVRHNKKSASDPQRGRAPRPRSLLGLPVGFAWIGLSRRLSTPTGFPLAEQAEFVRP